MPKTDKVFRRVIRVASTTLSLAPISPVVSAFRTFWVA